ncbi:MAG: SGNH/GDSL hydrolase family protein [Clostridia bacterium]|nr:SGNH/GDSL hydrolase family protein [Clostridia bacterium]
MRILFQGDSITDCGRSWSDNSNLGRGYPHLVEAELGYLEPAKHEFINRGISGNRVVDLYARIKSDIINLKPDVMSILIGVNDVWHELGDNPNGVDADKFFKIYCMLIEEVKAALPDIKIMILEPFVLKACSTEANWEYFDTETKKRAEMAKRVAEKYGLKFIPLQEGFDKLATLAENNYWIGDGVHPTPKGHSFIKSKWLEAFNEIR